MESERAPADLTMTVRAIRALVRQQQSGIVQFERETIEAATQQLTVLITTLQNPAVPTAEARLVIEETLSIVNTNLALLRVIDAARARLLDHFGGPNMAKGLLVNRSV